MYVECYTWNNTNKTCMVLHSEILSSFNIILCAITLKPILSEFCIVYISMILVCHLLDRQRQQKLIRRSPLTIKYPFYKLIVVYPI